ncbi:MAG: hypothetical protein GX442_13665 [Candidatus Riflebacteria bacterium]|nr:hypothetical protein [Candidatus Riflebacteria bacterium]
MPRPGPAPAKRRTPKPTPTPETAAVVRDLVPLLAHDVDGLTDDTLLTLARPAIETAVGYREAGEESPAFLLGIDTDHIRETVVGIQQMIRGREEMGAWIEEATAPIRPKCERWGPAGRLYKVDVAGRSASQAGGWWAVMFRAFWVDAVARSLARNDIRQPANGEAFFGACPRCGKVFAKRRGDQEYDRPTCQKEHTRK